MKRRILIIEKDKRDATELKRLLAKEGLGTYTVFSINDIYHRTRDDKFDLIFIDIDLWEENSSLFADISGNWFNGARVILTSRKYSTNGVLGRAMNAGVYGCIHKPFIKSEISGIISLLGMATREERTLVPAFVRHLAVMILLITSVLFQPFNSAWGMEGVPESIRSPQQIAEWFNKEFAYQLEMTDDWQKPKEMVASKMGDCEDFAMLAAELLRRIGISGEIAIIRIRGLGLHAICVWQDDNGNYNFFSNKELIYTGEKDIRQAVGKYFTDMEGLVIVKGEKDFLKKAALNL